MVGVVVTTHVVIGHYDIGSVPFDECSQPANGFGKRDVTKHVRAVLELPVGHSRVVVAEHLEVVNPQMLTSNCELSEPGLGHLTGVMPLLPRFDVPSPVSVLAVGAR